VKVSDIVIRPIREDDRHSWQKLYYAYLEFYASEPLEPATEILWRRLTAESPIVQSGIAELDGVVVGFVHFHFQISTWTHTWHCYLEDLFVDNNYRGRGVARSLIDEVKRAALEEKCSELYWITREHNTTARKLYDKVASATDFVRYEILLEK
jgi:ribosomal protein S18 acetylase RimI-like enzyme